MVLPSGREFACFVIFRKTKLEEITKDSASQRVLEPNNASRYHRGMIKSFRCKETEKLFDGRHPRRLPSDILKRAKMRLDRMDAATVLDDLRVPPSHRLEALSGDRIGQHSIRVNAQWRICFIWKNGHAYDVEIIDYH